MKFSTQKYWTTHGHPLLQESVSTQGSNLHLLCLLQCQADSLSLRPPIGDQMNAKEMVVNGAGIFFPTYNLSGSEKVLQSLFKIIFSLWFWTEKKFSRQKRKKLLLLCFIPFYKSIIKTWWERNTKGTLSPFSSHWCVAGHGHFLKSVYFIEV